MSGQVADLLLQMSDSQIDERAKDLIRQWSKPPKALEILHVLDLCTHGALASGFVMVALNTVYEMTCRVEGVTHEQLTALATWREQFNHSVG